MSVVSNLPLTQGFVSPLPKANDDKGAMARSLILLLVTDQVQITSKRRHEAC